MSVDISLPRLRPAGLFESYSVARHALGFYNNVAVTASYLKPGFVDALEPALFKALSDVIKRVPILCAIPKDTDQPSPYYARLPKIDLRHVVEFVDLEPQSSDFNQHLERVLNVQHSLNFENDGNSPFWRLVVFKNPEDKSNFVATFVYHHSIGDGMSGMAFHRHLHAALLRLNASAESEDVDSIVLTSPDTTLDPNLEALHPLPLSFWFISSKFWEGIFGSKNGGLWSGDSIDFSVAARKTNIILDSLSSEKVKVLLHRSREHSVSLTAMLETVLIDALFDNLSSEYTELVSSVTISLRRFIAEVNDDSMGNFASSNDHNYSRRDVTSQEMFWDETQRVKALLDTELERKGQDTGVGLLRLAGSLPEYFKKKENKERSSSIEVGNLGMFKYQQIPEPNDWMVGRMVFSQSHSAFGSPLSVSLATGPDGSLSISFAWLETTLERQWVENVIQRFQERVDTILQI